MHQIRICTEAKYLVKYLLWSNNGNKSVKYNKYGKVQTAAGAKLL